MREVSRKQAKELAALARMPDEKIDLTDAPEVREWREGRWWGAFWSRGKRALKKDRHLPPSLGLSPRPGDDSRGCRCAGVAEAPGTRLPDKD
jgi:hypothetical protein